MTKREKKNARFWRDSKTQRRVRVARDVIERMGERFTPHHGAFVARFHGGGYEKAVVANVRLSQDTPVEDALPDGCIACALGAMFICAVDRGDRLKLADMVAVDRRGDVVTSVDVRYKDIVNYLGTFFASAQIEMIECAYERGNGWVKNYDGSRDACVAFAPGVDKPGERMRLIMQNIVDCGGEFKP